MVRETKQPEEQDEQPKVVEREINLSLINDKLNYIISLLSKEEEKE
jgi:hypothetical protein